jgi:zinc transport system substrate-binding protein
MKRIFSRLLVALAAAAVAGVPACSSGGAAGGVEVATGFYALSEVVRAVGGSRVEVIELTPSGAQPHGVQPAAGQRDRARAADVVVYLGEGFQRAVEDLATETEGEAVDVLQGLSVVEGNPHVWLDPMMMRDVVERVRDALTAADDDGGDDYAEGAGRYLRRLAALDRAYRDGLADCDRNVVVTSHAAFEYVLSRYGHEEEAIAASPRSEPEPVRLAQLTELVHEAGVTTVFTEPLVTGGTAEALARDTATATAVLDPIESGDPDDAGGGYVRAMESNLDALRAGLGCR